jgi:predicted lipid-binding transport protein (Tim44 family)
MSLKLALIVIRPAFYHRPSHPLSEAGCGSSGRCITGLYQCLRRKALKCHPLARIIVAAAMLLTVSGLAINAADARRGGSFGSRGSRTYSAPRPTYGSSTYVPSIERSMTARPAARPDGSYNPGFGQAPPYRPVGSRFGGFGGGLIGGLIAGGLIGHFFGGGVGGGWGSGGGGMLASLVQLILLGGLVWLVIGFFRRRSGAQPWAARETVNSQGAFGSQPVTGPWGGNQPTREEEDRGIDITLSPTDQRDFEQLLLNVQDAFGREDYARLRQLTTPEIMSYLSEELSQNATRGQRNDVSGTRLLDAEVSEAWREASGDYATIVLRYESVDLMRDRATNAIVSGSATTPTETTELWTFFRGSDAAWKLSAIQES